MTEVDNKLRLIVAHIAAGKLHYRFILAAVHILKHSGCGLEGYAILRGTAAKQNSEFQSLSSLCLPFYQIFLQAQPFFIHLCGGLNANIPIMPYFLGNARDVGFISRGTEDKTVFVAVFLQSEIKIIGGSVDVHG